MRTELTRGVYAATPSGDGYTVKGRGGITIGRLHRTPRGWDCNGITNSADGARPPAGLRTAEQAFDAYLSWAGWVTG